MLVGNKIDKKVIFNYTNARIIYGDLGPRGNIIIIIGYTAFGLI